GIVVPGGFGGRGIEGKIAACKYARENNIPFLDLFYIILHFIFLNILIFQCLKMKKMHRFHYRLFHFLIAVINFLGICLGMQCAVIEFARNVCGIKGANSTEFDKTLVGEQQVVIDMPEHRGEEKGMGGTMRLGLRDTVFLTNNCKLRRLYDARKISERHRHRYEVNPRSVPKLSRAGLLFIGMGADGNGAHMNGSVSSYTSLMKLAESKTTKAVEENDTQEVYEISDAQEREVLLSKIEDLCRIENETDTTSVRMEIFELQGHPFFVGVQFHPEYLSHPLQPSPPFFGLICAASGQLESFLRGSKIPSPMSVLKAAENYSSDVAENVLQATHLFVNKVGIFPDQNTDEAQLNGCS
ncbi:unnamed protein product, partial [Onchocerca flexuosa]|uniref:CTP synthase (glutamine hydrolyzing) n=1 Tax=Onchocerca flexuosa TaxID=387005 RepID=A0A183HGW0_9BILA